MTLPAEWPVARLRRDDANGVILSYEVPLWRKLWQARRDAGLGDQRR